MEHPQHRLTLPHAQSQQGHPLITTPRNTTNGSKDAEREKGPLLYWTLWWRIILDDSQEATGIEPGTSALPNECMTDCTSRRWYYIRRRRDTEKNCHPLLQVTAGTCNYVRDIFACCPCHHVGHTQLSAEGPDGVSHSATVAPPQWSPWFGRRLPLFFVGCTGVPHRSGPHEAV